MYMWSRILLHLFAGLFLAEGSQPQKPRIIIPREKYPLYGMCKHTHLHTCIHTCLQYGVESSSPQSSPKLIEALSGKGLKQVTAGVRHCAASNTTLPVRGVTNIAIPSAVPSQYSALREVPCQAIHARLLLLNHFAKMITTSWRLFSIHSRPRVLKDPTHPI